MKFAPIAFMACVAFNSAYSVGFADSYSCTVFGSYDSTPGPGHPKGTYSEKFTGTGPTQATASQDALARCGETNDNCEDPSCKELILLDPRPLGPDTEVSCADDSGLQVEVTATPSIDDRLATVFRNGIQIAAYLVEPFTEDVQADLPG
jgi:hypothetical protein